MGDVPTIDACPVCGRLHVTPTEGAACDDCDPPQPEPPPAMASGGIVTRGSLLLLVGGDAVDAFRYGLHDLAATLATKLGPLLRDPPRASALSITIPDLGGLRSMLDDVASRPVPAPWPAMIMSPPDFARIIRAGAQGQGKTFVNHAGLRARLLGRLRPRRRAWRRPWSGRRR